MFARDSILTLGVALTLSTGSPPMFATRQDPPERTIESLEAGSGGGAVAIWELYEQMGRSPELGAALLRWLSTTHDIEARRVLDTLVQHWQLEHDPLTPREYLRGERVLRTPAECYPLPYEPLEQSTQLLLPLLSSANSEVRIPAVMTLLLRGEHSAEAIRSALPDVTVNEWLQDLAGQGLGNALGEALADA